MYNGSLSDQLGPLFPTLEASPAAENAVETKPAVEVKKPAIAKKASAPKKTAPTKSAAEATAIVAAGKAKGHALKATTKPAEMPTPAQQSSQVTCIDLFKNSARIELPVTGRKVSLDRGIPQFIDYVHPAAKDRSKGFWLRVYGAPRTLNMLLESKAPVSVDGNLHVFMASTTFEDVAYGHLVLGSCSPAQEVIFHADRTKMQLDDNWVRSTAIPGGAALEVSFIDESVQQKQAA